jgi:alpha-glucosidase (family GH31 glycosyl hydrolase)
MTDLFLTSGTALVRARFLAPNAVRITHAPTGAAEPPSDRPWLAHVLLPQALHDPAEASLVVTLEQGFVQVAAHTGAVVLAETQPPRNTGDGPVAISFAIDPGEGFYGFGEWFNGFHRERGELRLDSRESQAHNQWRQTYSNIPFVISSRGYGLLLLNGYRSTWRITPERRVLEIEADGPPADYIVIAGPVYRDIITTYTGLTGRPPLLPRWGFGLWVTGYPQEPQAVVEARVIAHRRRAIPLDGVILDYHWEAGFHTFRWRNALFPDPDGLITRLRAQGVRLGLIFTPFVNHRNNLHWRVTLQVMFRNVAAGQMRADERALGDYTEARAQGYLAHEDTWWWLGSGGMIDFANPAAATWWNERMRPLYDQGIVLFKNDDGEYLPDDARSALGMEGREYHNMYGFFYGRAIYDGMAALDDRRPMIYARSVWVGSQRYPAMFLGDQKPTFDHIRSTIRAGLNMGLLGFAYWTPDVFGLDGKTTLETHMRYAQWALLAPVARYFWRPPEIDNTRLPWSHGPEAEANFRAYARLRYRLLPYYCALAWEAFRTGLPLLRPMLLEYQEDVRFAGTDDQVLLGDRLLLAPVLEAGATTRQVLLPAGLWHDFWSGRSYTGGGTIDYPAPLDRLPILVRGGSILPLGPALDYIPDDHRFDELELHCWPPYPAACTLYDDDGRTRAYQHGQFSTTAMRVDAGGARVTVRIGAVVGGFPGQAPQRRITLVLQRCEPPAEAWVNGDATTWRYNPEERSVVVVMACPVEQETVVEISLVSDD